MIRAHIWNSTHYPWQSMLTCRYIITFTILFYWILFVCLLTEFKTAFTYILCINTSVHDVYWTFSPSDLSLLFPSILHLLWAVPGDKSKVPGDSSMLFPVPTLCPCTKCKQFARMDEDIEIMREYVNRGHYRYMLSTCFVKCCCVLMLRATVVKHLNVSLITNDTN